MWLISWEKWVNRFQTGFYGARHGFKVWLNMLWLKTWCWQCCKMFKWKKYRFTTFVYIEIKVKKGQQLYSLVSIQWTCFFKVLQKFILIYPLKKRWISSQINPFVPFKVNSHAIYSVHFWEKKKMAKQTFLRRCINILKEEVWKW